LAVWTAIPEKRGGWYAAVFNRLDTPQQVDLAWKDLGIPAGHHVVSDLWSQTDLNDQTSLRASLAPHASLLVWIALPKKFLPK